MRLLSRNAISPLLSLAELPMDQVGFGDVMDLVGPGDFERRLISPKQASRVKVEPADTAAVSPHAVAAAPCALLGDAHAEHHEVVRVQRRHGGAGQLRADGVHVEAARAAAVVHPADGRVADVAAAAS